MVRFILMVRCLSGECLDARHKKVPVAVHCCFIGRSGTSAKRKSSAVSRGVVQFIECVRRCDQAGTAQRHL